MGNVPGFLPSKNGLHYPNSWVSEPDITISTPFGDVGLGSASNGLCGGMVFAVRDLFDAGRTPPPDTATPPGGSSAFNYIVGRLIDSFNIPSGVLEYFTWMNLPTHNTALGPRGTSDLTINQTMPAVRAMIDSGQPCPIGLVCVHSTDPTMLGKNHQVLAYGYEDSGSITTLRVYDPNVPDNDDVTISFDHTNPTHTTTFNDSAGDTVLGFFVCNWYQAKDPSALFSQDAAPPPPPPPPALLTTCQPGTLRLDVPQSFEVIAKDPKTSQTVAGNVLVNGVRVGATGVELTDTFRITVAGTGVRPNPNPKGPGPAPVIIEPKLAVEAAGYAFSPVSVQFTV